MEKVVVRGIKAGCLHHLCEDDLFLSQFVDNNGEQVWVGSVSDGCSGVFGSENGAAFLVRTFAEEAEKLGKNGIRDMHFIRQVALEVVRRMADYQPRNPGSEIHRCCDGINISDELTATLYGFVADKERILLVMAGEGTFEINGTEKIICQEGDIYPVYMLRFPKETWEENLEKIFAFVELPTERVENFIIATDGFGHPNSSEYPGLLKDPAMFVLHSMHLANSEEDASLVRGGDDATAIAFAHSGFHSGNLLGADEIEAIGHYVEKVCPKDFVKRIREARCFEVRPCSVKNITDSLPFTRSISRHEGVYLFGITPEENKRYEHKRDAIIASRIRKSQEEIFAALFGEKKKAPEPAKHKPGKTATVTRLKTAARKKISDVHISQPKPGKATLTPGGSRTLVLPEKISRIISKEPGNYSVPEEKPRVRMMPIEKADPAPAVKTRKRKRKGISPETEWKPFQELCNRRLSRKYGIGFRHFGRVMYDLWHFVENCHNEGMRLGNLRPKDLLVKIEYEKIPERRFGKPVGYQFRLVNPNDAARVDSGNNPVKDYENLDLDFVHPDYAEKLATDDESRLNQDWYAFSVLCTWFIAKFDPFGEGVVKEKPDADRIYRMENILLSQSSEIEIDDRSRKFIKIALTRLSPKVVKFTSGFKFRENLRQSPDFLLEEFREENIIVCKAEIFKRNRKGRVWKARCGFKQLAGLNTCGYCNSPHVAMVTASRHLYQTEDQAAMV